MAAPSSAVAHIRASIARKSQSLPPNHPELHNLRRDLAVEGLAEHALKVVTGWPRPTDEQLQRIAAILRTAGPPGRTEVIETRLAELDGGGDHAA